VREPQHIDLIRNQLRNAAPKADILFLAADICRRELLLEIECVAQRGACNQLPASK
jgi:hypothetical protein